MERFVFKNSKGQELTIGYDDELILYEYEGLTDAEILPQLSQSYKQNGYTLNHLAMGQRVITISFFTYSYSLEGNYNKRKEITSILNPMLGIGTLIYTNDALTRAIDVIVSAQPKPVEKMGLLQRYEVEFTAYNPYWRDADETALVMSGFTGGLTFPIILNGETKFAEKTALTTIDNVGDIEAPIRVEFQGACSNPVLTNTTTGKKIKVNTSIAATDKLIINTAYGNKSVKKEKSNGDTESAYHLITLDSSFFQLAQGKNQLIFTSDSGSPEVFIYYHNWYVGV